MRARDCVVLVVATLACACAPGRRFDAAKTVSDVRPQRDVRVATGTLGDEPFRATPPPPAKIRHRAFSAPTEARLSNGVRVVMLERHDFPSASAVLVLERGAAAAAPGVAALYAEGLLGASREYSFWDAYDYLRFVGGHVDTFASKDAVMLELSALTPLFGSAMSRGAPMFASPLLEDDDLEEGRTRTTAVFDGGRGDPATIANEILWADVFPGAHPYGSPVHVAPPRLLSGPNADARLRVAERAALAAARAFRESYLSAENVSIACVGDLTIPAMTRVLEAAAGKLAVRRTTPPPPMPAMPAAEEAPRARHVLLVDRPGAAQTHVAIGWLGPRAADRDALALEVLSAATAGWLSSRLNLIVRKELGATYGVQMAADGLRHSGLIRISAAIATDRTVDALRGLFVEIERLRTEPLPDAELAAAKLRAYYDLEQGTTSGVAMLLATALAAGQPPAQVITHNARVDAITEDDVRNAAERWLARETPHVVVVGDASRIAAGLGTLGIGDITVSNAR